MNPSEHEHSANVDRLVASYLERQAEALDVSQLRSRIEQQFADSPAGDERVASPSETSPLPARRTNRVGWIVATAVASAIAFWGGHYFGPGTANAESVLQNVRVVHAQPIDRCYRVHYAPDSRYWDGENKLYGPSQSILWTRGDRFQADCVIADLELKIGRNAGGQLWVGSVNQGILFTGSETRLPKELETLCAINAMTVPRLVDDVLADFDLRSEERSATSSKGTTLVWADLKEGRSHPLLSAALMEIDPEQNAILRLVIWVVRDGRPNGTVTYTFIESDRRSDDLYELDSHLAEGADIDVREFGTSR